MTLGSPKQPSTSIRRLAQGLMEAQISHKLASLILLETQRRSKNIKDHLKRQICST
jgi:hypothetical protein